MVSQVKNLLIVGLSALCIYMGLMWKQTHTDFLESEKSLGWYKQNIIFSPDISIFDEEVPGFYSVSFDGGVNWALVDSKTGEVKGDLKSFSPKAFSTLTTENKK